MGLQVLGFKRNTSLSAEFVFPQHVALGREHAL
jgi:hypothetical protein